MDMNSRPMNWTTKPCRRSGLFAALTGLLLMGLIWPGVMGVAQSGDDAPAGIPTVLSTHIPGRFGGDLATWTPPAPDNRLSGNFVFRRPFADEFNTYWARTYAYGATDRGLRRPHAGIDFPNPSGTPILAAGDGTVYYAGRDVEVIFGPQPDFYGNLVVIEHTFMYSDGTRIYSLYGHMRDVAVQAGQQVTAGDVIGYVGSTGIAIGAHLHFEVRVGDPLAYIATRNPELWVIPYFNTGVLAGRVTDTAGNLLEGVQVEARAPGSYHMGYSYTGEEMNGDPILNENLAIPDIPAGYYTVTVARPDGMTLFRRVVYIWPGQVTWVDIPIRP